MIGVHLIPLMGPENNGKDGIFKKLLMNFNVSLKVCKLCNLQICNLESVQKFVTCKFAT